MLFSETHPDEDDIEGDPMTSEELRQANHIKISTVNASSSQLP